MPRRCGAAVLCAAAAHGATPPLTVVDLRDQPVAAQLAALTCAGLYNRDDTVAGSFIGQCLRARASGYIRYNATAQQLHITNI
eukprot:gene27202-12288_t